MMSFAGMNIQMVLIYTDLLRRSGQSNDVLLFRLKAILIQLVANDDIHIQMVLTRTNLYRRSSKFNGMLL